MKRLLIWIVAAVALLAGCSQYKYETVANDPLETKMYTLDNGLKVYMSVNKETPRIQTYIAVKVGGKNDPSETTGLAHYFETTMSCADIGAGKDKPDIYIAAKKALGFEADDICVFEDSYVALETAKNAGFKTIGIFDKNNYGQDRLEAASLIYIKEGEPLSIVNEAVTNN